MSEIYDALQALGLEQNGQLPSTNGSRPPLATSTVIADDFSVLREFCEQRVDGQEKHEQKESANQEAQHAMLAVSANDFTTLEKLIFRVVEMVKQERQERAAAEERALHAETELSEQALRIETLEKELNARKSERHSHHRVVRMLNLLNSLEHRRKEFHCNGLD